MIELILMKELSFVQEEIIKKTPLINTIKEEKLVKETSIILFTFYCYFSGI